MEKMNLTHLPPGFRFFPTDEELITHYLTRKASEKSFTSRAIAVVDLTKLEPWDLPGEASMGEKEWYFFSLRGRKYPTGLRTNRATRAGYWKTTGKDREVLRAARLIGMKKTLVFYKGRAPQGMKTNWVMHEYRLENSHHSHKSAKEEWVVCRVTKKPLAAEKPWQPQSSPDPPSEASSLANFEPKDEEVMPHVYDVAPDFSLESSDKSDTSTLPTMQSIRSFSDMIPNYVPETMSSTPQVDYNALLFKALEMRTDEAIRDELAAMMSNNIAGYYCSSLLPLVSAINSSSQASSSNVSQQQQKQPLDWSSFS